MSKVETWSANRTPLNLSDYSHIHASPTCGKSTLIQYYNGSRRLLDTDIFSFDIFTVPELHKLVDEGKIEAPWLAKHGTSLKLIWEVVNNAALAMAELCVNKKDNVTVITNLNTSRPSTYGKSVSFFREPTSLIKIFNERRAKDGKPPVKLSAARWVKGWERNAPKLYDEAFILPKGVYLSDVFGVSVDIEKSVPLARDKVVENFSSILEVHLNGKPPYFKLI